MEQRHRDAAGDVLGFKRRGHGNEVIRHGDDGEEQNQQESERYEGAPRLLGMAPLHRTRPEGNEKQ